MIGEVRDRVCIIVDDICDTAGTLVKAANLLKTEGAREVHADITHCVLSGPAVERVRAEKPGDHDSIEPTEVVRKSRNISIVPNAPRFGQATLNIANGTNVSSRFDLATLEPIYEALYPNPP